MLIRMNYKLLIFDFDGTLADTFPWFSENINKAAFLFRFKKVELHEYETLRGLTTHQIIDHLRISWWKIPLIVMYMRTLMTGDLRKISLFSQIDILLEEIKKKNIQIAIVSSNSKTNIETILGSRSALVNFYECGSSIFGKDKKLKRLLEKTKCDPLEVLCIGDETRDIEAARAMSLKCGAVTWGYANESALQNAKPDYIFASVQEILRIVDNKEF
jgi:phosphoglycolate phosphatase